MGWRLALWAHLPGSGLSGKSVAGRSGIRKGMAYWQSSKSQRLGYGVAGPPKGGGRFTSATSWLTIHSTRFQREPPKLGRGLWITLRESRFADHRPLTPDP